MSNHPAPPCPVFVLQKGTFCWKNLVLRTGIAVLMVLGFAGTAKSEILENPLGITFHSEDRSVSFTSQFPGGRMNECVQIADDDFTVTIEPESDPINDSAWYAFQVNSTEERTISVRLKYVGGSHRYDPKISRDGKTWENAEHLMADRHPAGTEVRLQIPVDGKPLWVAGQELLSSGTVTKWTSDLSQQSHVKRSVIGKSVQGRPLYRLDITETDRPDFVFIVARQHPPEVSGAIGMMHFVDSLTADNELATSFRKRYCAVVVPTVNPDGVALGNWRCNANGVDLNRDWMHFTQPETRALRNEMLKCRNASDQKLCLFMDFHSTFDDVFYTPPRNANLYPVGFADNWLSAIQKRFPNYHVNGDDNHHAHRSTSKAWVADTLGVTAITYEFGDETDRETIRRIASGSAEEMMKLLLELPEADARVAAAKVAIER